MRKAHLGAGILGIPASFVFLLLALVVAPRCTAQPVSSATLSRLLHSPFAEAKPYAELPDENESLRLLAQDLAFEAWVARKAKEQDYTLSPQEKRVLEEQRDKTEYDAVRAFLARNTTPTAEQVRKLAQERKWQGRTPDMYDIWYIFVDASQTTTSQSRQQLYAKALKIRDQLTTENFAQMARVWSDAPSSAAGGAVGPVTLESRGPTFAAQIQQTPPGTIGGPYDTASGWNLIYVRSMIPGTERSFAPETLRDMARQALAEQQAKHIQLSPEALTSAIKHLEPALQVGIREELQAYENRFLAGRFIRDKASATSPTEEDLKRLYEEKKSGFFHNPRRKAREILLTSDDWTTAPGKEAWLKRRAVRDRAREVRERIVRGEDFAQLARQLSSAADSATSGGELGWVEEPSSYLLDTTLAELKPGEVSAPVLTDTGYLLLQLEQVEQRKPMSFEKARPHLNNVWLYRQRKQVENQLKARMKDEG